MLAGQSWQTAAAESQLHICRATAYRLVQSARDQDKAPQIFLDDRHGHPYQLTAPVQAWISELCTTNQEFPSSRVQSELKSCFGIVVSVSQINRVRAKLGVSHRWHGRVQALGKKN